jgi:UDP-N-acetylmuramoyl-tripeptide--D-alanyl-D-alanine ligase
MLQASEYNIVEFFSWFRRVKDFGRVEERKTLVKTTKAIILFILGSIAHILFFVFSVSLLFIVKSYWSYIYFVIAILIFPYSTLYFLALFAGLIKIIQSPIEKYIINKARTKLQNHKALKIAVAGSYGKTTMKEILKVVLEESISVAATPENKNTPLGIARFVEKLTGNEKILIFEMGEYYPGDVKKLCEIISPDIGIITGVNEAHLNKFKNIEITAKTIFELADFLQKKENTKLYVNGDNRIVLEKAHHYKNKKIDSPQIYVYSQNGVENITSKNESDWKVEGAETNLSGTSFVLKDNKDKGIVVRSGFLGLHQVGPLSVSAHLAQRLNVKLEDIELGLKKTKAFEHRLEKKEENGGVTIIDDSYNGSPDGVRAAINFLVGITNKRRFYITPGLVEMGEKTEDVHKNIGKQLAEANIEKVVLIKNSVTHFIEYGLKESNYKGEIIWFESAKDLFSSLPKMTANNDLLLYQNDWPDNYA